MTQHHPFPRNALAALALCALVACQNGAVQGAGPASIDGDIAVLRLPEGASPPAKAGQCWASDTAPAVIETTTQQVQLRPERRNSAGQIIQSAQFQTHTAQRMVNDRATIWFAAPCPDEITVGFVASLQRALKARGRFFEPVTGAWDAPTLEALRKFQRERGLDSAAISLAAAQELGLAAAPIAP
ncbi:MAG: peptidoglycan-binding domain-containing protein [Cypionkella sp.]|nr:peptidoglycan-binding domain-containing protein [Cypionkella sp.]